jgi:hypothetical protein
MAEPKAYTLGITTRTHEGKDGKEVYTFVPHKVFISDTVMVEKQITDIHDDPLLERIYRIIYRLNGTKPNWHHEMWRVRDGVITQTQVS